MKANLFRRLAWLIGFRRPSRSRPAWFDDTYMSVSPHQPEPARAFPGRSYDERERAAIWRKARVVAGWDPEDWRADHSGNPIFRHHFADLESAYGWTIVLIDAGGGDGLANLRPALCHESERRAARFERALDLDRFER